MTEAEPTPNDAAPADPAPAEADAGVTNATPADETSETSDNPDGLAKARKEAASYRQRLRETEATRDQLTSTVDSLRKQIIEQQVNAAGLKPAVLWSTVELGDLLTDDGTVDPEKVTTALEMARAELGINRFQGQADLGVRSTPSAPEKTWSGLLKPKS